MLRVLLFFSDIFAILFNEEAPTLLGFRLNQSVFWGTGGVCAAVSEN